MLNVGNFPHVRPLDITSSNTLPYGACSIGFSPKLINKIYGACKIYDTRSGLDPEFPEKLLEDKELLIVANEGKEYGTTTGRRRKVNWLNLEKLQKAINISGTTDLIISKLDVLENIQNFKLFNTKLVSFDNLDLMKEYIKEYFLKNCNNLENIIYSNNVEHINELVI